MGSYATKIYKDISRGILREELQDFLHFKRYCSAVSL